MASQDDPSSLLGIDLGGRYRIKDFIDSGAFSFVYRACDLNNGTDVAVKVLQPRCAGQVAIWEMNGERQLLSTMSSRSNIIDTYDGERHDLTLNIPGSGASLTVPLHYVAMELASGTLSDVVLYRDRFSWDDRLSLFRAVAKGLHQMHISDIVHRDLKSDNVLLFTAPDQPVAKLCDLGRGVAVNEPRRFPREAYAPGRGHRLYAPPEYIWEIGSTDPSSWQKGDLYLLGSVLYELATGYQITSAVTAAVHGMANPYQHLSIDERRDRFFGSIRKLEAYYEGAWGIFDQELPAAIRPEGARLIRQLTSPDPRRRGPIHRWKVEHTWDLNWGLRRIDIMRKILVNESLRRQRIYRRRAGG